MTRWLAGFLMLLAACGKAPEARGPVYGGEPLPENRVSYRLAVHPLHNPSRLFQVYQPLVDHINRQLPGAQLELEASRDYQTFEAKLREGSPGFLLPNPWQTLEAMKTGYGVIAMAGDAADFRGILVVRRDSGIRQPGDLKGHAVSYPSPTALAACVMPQYFLHRQGLDVNRDITNLYVGSQESSIMNAYLGKSMAGATWPPPWRAFQKDHPKEAAELRVLWETPPLVNNSVMARLDVPAEIRDQVRAALLKVHESPEGRAILAGMETARFHAAADRDYETVRQYVRAFEREVRPVDRPAEGRR